MSQGGIQYKVRCKQFLALSLSPCHLFRCLFQSSSPHLFLLSLLILPKSDFAHVFSYTNKLFRHHTTVLWMRFHVVWFTLLILFSFQMQWNWMCLPCGFCVCVYHDKCVFYTLRSFWLNAISYFIYIFAVYSLLSIGFILIYRCFALFHCVI